ncbi:MAG: hypothetical protein NT027_19515 [Proteobacteria bacterium]|nr:hypothetical protein [Pseudomonadota bacterium]
MNRKNKFKLCLFALGTMTSLASSCGRKEQKIQTLSTTATATGSDGSSTAALQSLTDPTCTSSKSCKEAQFKIIDDTGKEPDGLNAKVGKEIEWTFQLSTKSIEGRLLVATKQYPIWADIKNGTKTGSKIIFGTPSKPSKDGEIIFIVRDMMKCKVSEKKLETCLDV